MVAIAAQLAAVGTTTTTGGGVSSDESLPPHAARAAAVISVMQGARKPKALVFMGLSLPP